MGNFRDCPDNDFSLDQLELLILANDPRVIPLTTP
jgi:hypothetical protein